MSLSVTPPVAPRSSGLRCDRDSSSSSSIPGRATDEADDGGGRRPTPPGNGDDVPALPAQPLAAPPVSPYFLGFERSPPFEELWHRLQALEAWRELAIRPASVEECHPQDRHLLPANYRTTTTIKGWEAARNDDDDGTVDEEEDEQEQPDDMPALKEQCLSVRRSMNEVMSTMAIETTEWDGRLVARTSQIPDAGLGLYYEYDDVVVVVPPATTADADATATTAPAGAPPASSSPPATTAASVPTDTILCYCTGHIHSFSSSRELPVSSSPATTTTTQPPPGSTPAVPGDTTLCYYTGHIHSFSSSRELTQDRSYLLWVRGDTLVDPRSLLYVKARYINDPRNDDAVNCKFVPEKVDGADVRAAVVTTRTVFPGEELFVTYGDHYWDQQPTAGTRWVRPEQPPPAGCGVVIVQS